MPSLQSVKTLMEAITLKFQENVWKGWIMLKKALNFNRIISDAFTAIITWTFVFLTYTATFSL